MRYPCPEGGGWTRGVSRAAGWDDRGLGFAFRHVPLRHGRLHRSQHAEKAALRLQITAIQTIKSRLKARCLNYAIQMERQLGLQHKSQGFLDAAQNEVNNFFKARSEDVYLKLQKATQLAASKDLEDCALLLTEVRRALKAAADFFYTSAEGMVICADGKERLMGGEQY